MENGNEEVKRKGDKNKKNVTEKKKRSVADGREIKAFRVKERAGGADEETTGEVKKAACKRQGVRGWQPERVVAAGKSSKGQMELVFWGVGGVGVLGWCFCGISGWGLLFVLVFFFF